jgi:AcrR family transcriptional regulator
MSMQHTDDSLKETILGKVIAAMAANGLNNLSLRDIAAETGVSARMLIYHFGSYEKMINAVFIKLSVRHKQMLNLIISNSPDGSPRQAAEQFTTAIFRDEYRNALLLFVEFYVKGLRNIPEHGDFYDEVLHNWIREAGALFQGADGKTDPVMATTMVAFFRGLLLDWLATGDTERCSAGCRLFLQQITGNR